MAKCIRNKKTKKVERVSDEMAHQRCANGEWEYISKSMFKRLTTVLETKEEE